jgi:hypothetical protein
MENDLVSLYESNYLKPQNVVEEKKELPDFIKKKIAKRKGENDDSEDEDDNETHDEAVKRKLNKAKKTKNSMKTKSKKPNPGEIYGDSFNRSGNIFDQILREMDEMGGGNFNTSSTDDNVFNADEQIDSGEEESFTLSELRSMSLGELANILANGEEEDDDYEENYDEEFEDAIPSESYGFSGGENNHKGNQGTYDGKAKRQAPTTHVKSNGDADFSDQDTEYDPDDTEGSEGSHMGNQGTYDGKAKRQAPTTHVKSNGDADFAKANTGIKTSSGKKPKNYF